MVMFYLFLLLRHSLYLHVGKEQNENSFSAVAWKQRHATAEIEFSFYLCGGC